MAASRHRRATIAGRSDAKKNITAAVGGFGQRRAAMPARVTVNNTGSITTSGAIAANAIMAQGGIGGGRVAMAARPIPASGRPCSAEGRQSQHRPLTMGRLRRRARGKGGADVRRPPNHGPCSRPTGRQRQRRLCHSPVGGRRRAKGGNSANFLLGGLRPLAGPAGQRLDLDGRLSGGSGKYRRQLSWVDQFGRRLDHRRQRPWHLRAVSIGGGGWRRRQRQFDLHPRWARSARSIRFGIVKFCDKPAGNKPGHQRPGRGSVASGGTGNDAGNRHRHQSRP